MAKTAADARSAIDLLAETKPGLVPPIVALFGDEPFLKRLVPAELRRRVAEGDDGDFSAVEFSGTSASLSDVLDQLRTRSLFGGGRRVVVVEEADRFVTEYRPQLEDYAAQPSSAGVLVLDVATWPANTRLYKAVAALGGNIACTAPGEAALVKWLIGWTKRRYGASLQTDAAEALVEQVGPEMGLLDQELAKLAAAAGTEGNVTCESVNRLVGSWRTKTAWEMIDAAVEGRTVDAYRQLDRLTSAGEHPIALLAQTATTLRRFAAAVRLLEEAERSGGGRISARGLLEQAGFKPFVLDKAERQWRQLGRQRSGMLYGKLLEADVALKGRSSSPPRSRLVLEQLLAWMSPAADPRKA